MFHHSFYSQEKHINNREMCCVSLFFLGHPCNLRMTYKTLLSYVYFHIYIYFLRKLAGNRLIRQNTVNIHMAVLTYLLNGLLWCGRVGTSWTKWWARSWRTWTLSYWSQHPRWVRVINDYADTHIFI